MVRSDKGEVRLTERDLACLLWIAEQYAVRIDQVQKLLSRYPDPQHPPKEDLVSISTTRSQVDRWRRAGWVVARRVLANGPGWVYITRSGLQLLGLVDHFTAYPPSPFRLNHLYAVNQVRLWMDVEDDYRWQSERHYRANLHLKRGESAGAIPDALIWPDGDRTAVEVQISALKQYGWSKKLSELLKAYQQRSDTYGYEKKFPTIWFYLPTDAMLSVFRTACRKLNKEDQARVSGIVQSDLLAEDAWV